MNNKIIFATVMSRDQVLSNAHPAVIQTNMIQQPGFQQPGIVQQTPVVIQQTGMVQPQTYPAVTTVVGAQQPNVVYQPTVPYVYQSYKSRQTRILGILQIVIGGLSVVFMIAAMSIEAGSCYIGSGFYCGGIVSI